MEGCDLESSGERQGPMEKGGTECGNGLTRGWRLGLVRGSGAHGEGVISEANYQPTGGGPKGSGNGPAKGWRQRPVQRWVLTGLLMVLSVGGTMAVGGAKGGGDQSEEWQTTLSHNVRRGKQRGSSGSRESKLAQ
jgi:hypothetical protein